MTWEHGSSDQLRLRAGYAVLSLGILILLLAWGMAVMRGPQGQGEVAVRHQKLDPPEPDRMLPVVGVGMLLAGTCLVLIFVLSIVAFLRVSRSYRDHLLGGRASPTPTPTADVWEMHKLPDVGEEDESDDA